MELGYEFRCEWDGMDVNADHNARWQNKWAWNATMLRLSSEELITQKAQPKNYLNPLLILNAGAIQFEVK